MGVALSGLGVAEVTSCVLMYPVASMDKPFSAPQGRAMAQGFFPFVYVLGSLLLMLPTGIVALVMLLTGAEGGIWLAIIPVALANGIGILALGTWLGGKLMDARMLSIVQHSTRSPHCRNDRLGIRSTMVSTAVSRRQRREAQRRTQRSHRRTLTVIISALTTIALFAGYCAADITDVAPDYDVEARRRTCFCRSSHRQIRRHRRRHLERDKAIDSTAASALVNELLSAQGVGNDTSVIIEDAQGTVAAEHESNTPREPASTLKTLTALAASSTLNMASTLDTQVFLTQSDDGTNTLTLKGNGDMLLSAGDSDANHTNGRAGLNTLAKATVAALAQRGITSVNLEYDDTLFGDSRIPAGLSEGGAVLSDYTVYFTPVSSMAIDGGRQYTADTPAPADPMIRPDTRNCPSTPPATWPRNSPNCSNRTAWPLPET